MRRLKPYRRWLLPALIALALTVEAGCRRSKRPRVETVEEDQGPLASVVVFSDPRTSMQLVRGFYEMEGGAWRWTMGKFTVTLRPPPGSSEKGARLEVKLAVPEAVIAKIGPVSLSATVGGLALEPQTFSAPGDGVYARDVPASALGGEAATFDFALDKYLAAGVVEQRELGIIVSSVGLTTK